jgi:hypothetical protein
MACGVVETTGRGWPNAGKRRVNDDRLQLPFARRMRVLVSIAADRRLLRGMKVDRSGTL